MSARKINAVLFDLGETLITFGKVNTTKLFYKGARQSYDFLKSCGQPTGNFVSYCLRNFIPLRINHMFSTLTANDFDSLTLLKKINEKKGIRLDEQQWRQLVWLWYEPLSKLGKTEPDIIKSLTALKESGLKLAIVSNTFLHESCLDRHLREVGILDFFQFRFYSYQFDYRKPDPRIFQISADKIGEQPQNILFVGDRLDNDINPALKAGMRSVLKRAYTNTAKRIPDSVFEIEKISDLPALIHKINNSQF